MKLEPPDATLAKNRTFKMWERDGHPVRELQLWGRDTDIMRFVGKHRFLQVQYVHALLGGGDSRKNLGRRMLDLFRAGYLYRTKVHQSPRPRTEELVYGLRRKGARYLESVDPKLRELEISTREWEDEPKKIRTRFYVDHQLGVTRFLVPLQIACTRLGYGLRWLGHFDRTGQTIEYRKEDGKPGRINPDAALELVRGDGLSKHYFLETDESGYKQPNRLREKIKSYFWWWKSGQSRHLYPDGFQVLVVTENADHMRVLRRATLPVGRDQRFPTWGGVLFTHLEAFSLEEPERIFEPIFCYADDEDGPVSLLADQ